MRRLLGAISTGAVLWCLWWGLGSVLLRVSVEDWLDARRAEGWQADAQVSGGGFPLVMTAGLDDLALADPATGLAVSASRIRLEIDAPWPFGARLVLPEDPVRFSSPDRQAVTLVMSEGQMDLALAPSQQLGLRGLAWTAGPWGLSDPRGSIVSADSLEVSMTQMETPETYAFVVHADSAAPGETLRARLRLPEDWPLAFETFRTEAEVTFDRPWDLRALEERRPQPTRVEIGLAEAAWGDLRLNLAADLAVDEGGIATGEISLQARNWRTMLTLAERSGALPARLRDQAETVLASLAGATGNPDTLDLRLTARGGTLYLGFVPLGPAPRLSLR